jgi:aldehyde dehydrogenase (NAD+)
MDVIKVVSTSAAPAAIPDDIGILPKILEDLQAGAETHITRDCSFRIGQLESLRTGLVEMKDEICEAIGKDLGRGMFYAYISELHLMLTEIDHTIAHLRSWMEPKVVDTPVAVGPGSSYVKAEPLGVVLVMSAWNYPVYTLLGPGHQVIAAGNCCLFKPSEVGPHCCWVLTKLITKYLDQRFYRAVPGQTEVAKFLVRMRFDMLVFTGST